MQDTIRHEITCLCKKCRAAQQRKGKLYMKTILKKFSDMTVDELYAIMKLRVDVFVVEQNCPYHELDGLDIEASHLWLEDDQGIAAYLRILPPGAAFPEPALGRVISARRRCGVGSVLLEEGISAVQQLYGSSAITIEAQVYAKPFYEKAGFFQVSEPFDEDGIPHIRMRWEPAR